MSASSVEVNNIPVQRIQYADPANVKEDFLTTVPDKQREHVIALLQIGDLHFVATVNPTGRPGARTIMSFYDPADMKMVLNREYKMNETFAFEMACDAFSHSLRAGFPRGVIVQDSKAGNRAHLRDSETGGIIVGRSQKMDKEKGIPASEGSKLHRHFWLRPNDMEILPGVTAGGPETGKEFSMMTEKGFWPKDHPTNSLMSSTMLQYATKIGSGIRTVVEQYNKANGLPEHLQIKVVWARDSSNVSEARQPFL